MIGRRDFITLLGGAAAAWPLTARAQQPERSRRIGVLMGIAEGPLGQVYVTALLDGLRELGWTDGRNVRIDIRWAAGSADQARAFAKELSDGSRDCYRWPKHSSGRRIAAGDSHAPDCVRELD
jgi:putative tryptophan/tyrosine transport system substrate-binding protein